MTSLCQLYRNDGVHSAPFLQEFFNRRIIPLSATAQPACWAESLRAKPDALYQRIQVNVNDRPLRFRTLPVIVNAAKDAQVTDLSRDSIRGVGPQ